MKKFPKIYYVVCVTLIVVSVMLVIQSIRSAELNRELNHYRDLYSAVRDDSNVYSYSDQHDDNSSTKPELEPIPHVTNEAVFLDWDKVRPALEYDNPVLGVHSYKHVYDDVTHVRGYVYQVMESIVDDSYGIVFIGENPDENDVEVQVHIPIADILELVPGQLITVSGRNFEVNDILIGTVFITVEDCCIVDS